MPTEQAANNAQSSVTNDFKFPMLGNSEWLTSFSKAPAKFYAAAWNQALGLTASHLQEQADYVKKLGECTDPVEALKCHTEFVQNSLKRSYSDGAKLFETLRTRLSSTLPSE